MGLASAFSFTNAAICIDRAGQVLDRLPSVLRVIVGLPLDVVHGAALALLLSDNALDNKDALMVCLEMGGVFRGRRFVVDLLRRLGGASSSANFLATWPALDLLLRGGWWGGDTRGGRDARSRVRYCSSVHGDGRKAVRAQTYHGGDVSKCGSAT
jgi:hypothetical protein